MTHRTGLTAEMLRSGTPRRTRRYWAGASPLAVAAAALFAAGAAHGADAESETEAKADAAQADQAAQAQQQAEEEATRLEEIVVTGTKRGAQRIQDVPETIQAIGSGQIEDLLATDFTDLAGQVPSLQFQDLGPGDKEFIIRGINSDATATVGVYYGESVITARNKQDGGGRQALFEMHDLDRIEVLKGPRGTTFGAGSMSGTIRFIPNRPDPTAWDFDAEVEISDTNNGGGNQRANGMINVPVVEDELAVRAVGWITRESGFVDNVRLGNENINSNDVDGGRFALRWTPIPELDINASVTLQNRDVGGSSRFSPRFQQNYRGNLEMFGFDTPELGDLTNDDFNVSDWDEDMTLYSLVAEYDAGWGEFLATSNFFNRDITFRFDSTPVLLNFADALNFPILGTPAVTRQPQGRDVWTNEFRFNSDFDGPVNFMVGAFVSREDKEFDVEVLAVDDKGEPIGPFNPEGDFFIDEMNGVPFEEREAAIFGRTKSDDLDKEAIFGEVTVDITERLQLVGGVRLFQWDITSAGADTKPFLGFGGGATLIDVSTGTDTAQFRANVSYDVSEDHLVYFTAAEGFRVGGTNDNAINPTGAPIPVGFEPDNLWNYEIGWKTSWFDDRLILNGAAYLIFWDDLQVSSIDPSGAFPFIDNAGEARVDGFEFSLTARPMRGLELRLGGSFQDARITEDQPLADPNSPTFDPNAGRKGDEIPNVPDLQGFFSAQYQYPIAAELGGFQNLDGVFRVDVSYRGETDTEFRETSPFNVDLDSYALVNLKAGIQSEHWRFSVFGRNVTDQRAEVDAINTTQDPLGRITARPATYGLNVAYDF